MASVTFSQQYGGDGSTVSDDADPFTGLDAGGHRTRFVPSLAQVVAVAAFAQTQAKAALESAASAVNAPGTTAMSSTSMLIEIAPKSFNVQTGKLFSVGQTVVIASRANPLNQMTGIITVFTSSTGAMTVNVSTIVGSGTFTDWNIAVAAVAGIPLSRQIIASGLATGGGDFSADRTILVPKAAGIDLWFGNNDTKGVTSKAIYDASASVAITFSATITPVSTAGINFHFIATGNFTLANLQSALPGECGRLRIIQDATGGRIMTFPTTSAYKFPGGQKPVLSTSPGAVDLIVFFVHDANNIECAFIKDVK